jgi:hypothetical protein
LARDANRTSAAVTSGIYGSAFGDTPEERALNTATGIAGGVVGARAGELVGDWAKARQARSAARRAARPNARAQRAYELADRYGVPLTRGQATGDVDMRLAEDAMRRRGGPGRAIIGGFDDQQATALGNVPMSIAARGGEPISTSLGDAGAATGNALRNRYDLFKAQKDKVYSMALEAAGDAPIAPSDELMVRVGEVVEENFINEPGAMDTLSRLQRQVSQGKATYQTTERARQELNSMLADAMRAGEGTRARALHTLIDTLDTWTGSAVSDPVAKRYMLEARAINKELHEFYGRNLRPELATGHVGDIDAGGNVMANVLGRDMTGEQFVDAILGRTRPTTGTLAAVRRIRAISEAIKYTNYDAPSGIRVPGRPKVGSTTAGEDLFASATELPADELQGLREAVAHRLVEPLAARAEGGMIPVEKVRTQLRALLHGPGREVAEVLFREDELARFDDYLQILEHLRVPEGANRSNTTHEAIRALGGFSRAVGEIAFKGANALTGGMAGAVRQANNEFQAGRRATEAISRYAPPRAASAAGGGRIPASYVPDLAGRAAVPLMQQGHPELAEMTGVPAAKRSILAAQRGDVGGALMEGGSSLLALAPGAKPALAGLGALGAGAAIGQSAQAQERDTLDADLANARSRRDQLEADLKVFDTGTPIEVQRLLQRRTGFGGRIDGQIGPETTRAIDDYLTQVRADLEKVRGEISELETNIAYRDTRPEGWHLLLREAGPWATMMGGIGLGYLTRRGAIGASRQKLMKLLTAGPVVTGRSAAQRAVPIQRAANINEFWRRGGAGDRVPFVPRPNSPAGYARRSPRAAEPSELFLNRGVGQSDLWFSGALGAEAGVTGYMAFKAHEAAREAEEVARQRPTRANLAAAEAAKDWAATLDAAWRFGAGAAGGRLIAASKMPQNPPVAEAEAERMLLDQFVAPRRAPRARVPRAPRRAPPKKKKGRADND